MVGAALDEALHCAVGATGDRAGASIKDIFRATSATRLVWGQEKRDDPLMTLQTIVKQSTEDRLFQYDFSEAMAATVSLGKRSSAANASGNSTADGWLEPFLQ